MGEYTGRIEIDRPPEAVFGFLSDIRNMPRYLPTVRHVGPQGAERVSVEGETNGHAYHADGWLRVEPDAMRMRWGSDSMKDYHGELTVTDAGGRAAVALQLSITPEPRVAERMQRESGSVDHAMRLAMERTLGAIRTACEQADDPDAPRSADDLPDSRMFGSSATVNPDI